ncbi:MAG: hypothetical protein ACKVJF_11990 [Flavobacteriales bacterium]
MELLKENKELNVILGKLRNFLRPIYYNGTAVTYREREMAKELQTVSA